MGQGLMEMVGKQDVDWVIAPGMMSQGIPKVGEGRGVGVEGGRKNNCIRCTIKT